MKPILLAALFFAPLLAAYAQCDHDPMITGDTILCPQKSGILRTQPADAYQWYKRAWGSSQMEPIPGAAAESLNVYQADILNYYTVDVTLSGCTERSPEKLLDGYAFLPPTVSHSGKYRFNGNTQVFEICEGDTMFMKFNLPYDTNITWFRNGTPVPGADSSFFAVTESGDYTVEGAPKICPEWIQPLGLTLTAEIVNCGPVGTGPGKQPTQPRMYQKENTVHIISDHPQLNARVFNAMGQEVLQMQLSGNFTQVDIQQLAPGPYFLQVNGEDQLPQTFRISR